LLLFPSPSPCRVMALFWVCAFAAALASAAEEQPQLRLRGSNATFLTTAVKKASSSAHLAWMPDLSFCLSSDGNRIGNGVKVQLWQCDNKWHSIGQNFFLDDSGRIRMHLNPDYCLVIDGDKYENGAKIQLWKCNDSNKHQTWYFNDAGQIQARNSPTQMCLVIDSNQAFNGAKIQLWSCQRPSDKLQDWVKIALSPSGSRAYALPDEDKACKFPFEPVATDTAACVEAAEAIRPGQGCHWGGGWADVVSEVSYSNWPQGCYFYAACQGGCSLGFNPTGQGSSCPTQGECMSISMICQMSLQ